MPPTPGTAKAEFDTPALCLNILSSDDADYITGSTLRVDGGFMVSLTLKADVTLS